MPLDCDIWPHRHPVHSYRTRLGNFFTQNNDHWELFIFIINIRLSFFPFLSHFARHHRKFPILIAVGEGKLKAEDSVFFFHFSKLSRFRSRERSIFSIEKMEKFIDNLPPMDLMRSEKMTFVQLIIPVESAHRAISYLGELGLLQFRDVSFLPDPT